MSGGDADGSGSTKSATASPSATAAPQQGRGGWGSEGGEEKGGREAREEMGRATAEPGGGRAHDEDLEALAEGRRRLLGMAKEEEGRCDDDLTENVMEC